jgi:hypothetical protein
MSKMIIVEALIASPPTSKCQETIGILEDAIRRHPDKLRLVVFSRGVDIYPDEASAGLKNLMQKGCAVPACIVNGILFSSSKVPNPEELEARVQEVLLRTAGE